MPKEADSSLGAECKDATNLRSSNSRGLHPIGSAYKSATAIVAFLGGLGSHTNSWLLVLCRTRILLDDGNTTERHLVFRVRETAGRRRRRRNSWSVMPCIHGGWTLQLVPVSIAQEAWRPDAEGANATSCLARYRYVLHVIAASYRGWLSCARIRMVHILYVTYIH